MVSLLDNLRDQYNDIEEKQSEQDSNFSNFTAQIKINENGAFNK